MTPLIGHLGGPVARAALWGLLVVLAVGAGGLLLAWSGLYNVAASSGHWAITRELLELGMRSSVRTQSLMIASAPIGDGDLVALGAGHFASGCAPCHGAPGKAPNPITRAMLPPPPRLSGKVARWKDRELFWIVKHGIKYAGMPAWVSQRRDDEVWAMVAFLRRLPQLTSEAYADLANGQTSPREPDAAHVAAGGITSTAITACTRCHGNGETLPASDRVPRLAGQSERYLAKTLRDYASGRRESGIMQPVAAELDSATIDALARHYTGLRPPILATRPVTEDAVAPEGAGRRLAIEGDPPRAVPACDACHGANASAAYPRLGGQSAAYMAGQLALWRNGVRTNTAEGQMMAEIARRLTPADADAVARYYSGLGSGAPAVRSGTQ